MRGQPRGWRMGGPRGVAGLTVRTAAGVAFGVEVSCCDNPRCPRVHLDLVEVAAGAAPAGGADALKREAFSVDIDADAWELIAPETVPEPVVAAARALVAEGERRDRLREIVLDARATTDAFQLFRMRPRDVEAGLLVPYADILAASPRFAACPPMSFSVLTEGAHYNVEDAYCPTPWCDCRKVELAFFRCPVCDGHGHGEDTSGLSPHQRAGEPSRGDDAPTPHVAGGASVPSVQQALSVFLGLDGAILSLAAFEVPEDEARRLVAAWRDQHPGAMATLADRYARVKAMGVRLLDAPDSGRRSRGRRRRRGF